MTILLIGIRNWTFLRDLKKELVARGHEVDLLDPQDGYLVDSAGNKDDFGITPPAGSFFKKNVAFVRNFQKFKKRQHQYPKKYDVCNIHFADIRYYFFRRFLSKLADKLVISTYGSDFNIYRKYAFMQKPLYRAAQANTFANAGLLKRFDEFYHHEFTGRLHLCRFGLSRISDLSQKKTKPEVLADFRIKHGIPDDKILITIGYNSNPIHQQEKILQEIFKLDEVLLEKVFLIFPMTYGGFTDQIKRVKELIRSGKLSALVLTEFLSEEEVNCLRLSSQVFVHLIKHDQLSATMCEYLFTRNYVITGAWLPYEPIDELGVNYSRLSNFEELTPLLTEIILNKEVYFNKTIMNPGLIEDFSTWDNNIKNWLSVYTA